LQEELWVKEVENPISKPIDQWRDELYGYWMVITDIKYSGDVDVAMYF